MGPPAGKSKGKGLANGWAPTLGPPAGMSKGKGFADGWAPFPGKGKMLPMDPSQETSRSAQVQAEREAFFERLPPDALAEEEVALVNAISGVLLGAGGSSRLNVVSVDPEVKAAKQA